MDSTIVLEEARTASSTYFNFTLTNLYPLKKNKSMIITQHNTLDSDDFLQNLFAEKANDLDDFLHASFKQNEFQEPCKQLSADSNPAQFSKKLIQFYKARY